VAKAFFGFSPCLRASVVDFAFDPRSFAFIRGKSFSYLTSVLPR
jgi:hypothetical protein